MKNIKYVLLVLLIVSCSHLYKPKGSAPEVVARAPDSVEKLDYEILKRIIQTKNYSSVDQVIEHLSKSHPGYMAYHTFMTNSHSLQTSDWQHPRAIVFGSDAKFIISFNSASNNEKKFTGSNAIETLSWDARTKSFELREILFKEGALPEDLLVIRNSNHNFSQPNPQKCLDCHGINAEQRFWQISAQGKKFDRHIRPIWNQYADWPRAYFARQNQVLNYEMQSGTPEDVQYKIFTGKNGNRFKGRYKDLPPLALPNNNEELNSLLYQLNYSRIVALLMEKRSLLLPYRYNLISPWFCGRNLNLLNTGIYKSKFAQIFTTVDRRNIQDRYETDLDLESHIGKINSEAVYYQANANFEAGSFITTNFSVLIAYAEHFGIDTQDWGLSSYPNNTHFNEGNVYSPTLLKELIEKLFSASEKADLERFISYQSAPPIYGTEPCSFITPKITPLPAK